MGNLVGGFEVSEFYIDVDKAVKIGVVGRVKVRLNGVVVNRVLAAKSGANGFVKYTEVPIKVNTKTGELVNAKKRGNVKISIAKV